MRQHIAIIKSIQDTGHDFELFGVRDNEMGLTDDTAQWLEHDFWSKHCNSFCKKSDLTNTMLVHLSIIFLDRIEPTVHLVLLKVPHGCKKEHEIIMRTFKKAEEEAPQHANRTGTDDFINTIREVSNFTTKKTLAIVKKIQISRKHLQLHWKYLGWSSSRRLGLWYVDRYADV